VFDTAGTPVDGGPRPALDGRDVRLLAAGEAVSTGTFRGDPRRWVGRVVSTPHGAPRLVVAAADVVGYTAAVRPGALSLLVAAVVAAAVVGGAALVAARSALAPVRRTRAAAVALAPGERRPEPVARDEVEYAIGLPGEGADTEVFFSDLGHEYVRINADYRT